MKIKDTEEDFTFGMMIIPITLDTGKMAKKKSEENG